MIIKGVDTVEFGLEVEDYFSKSKSLLALLNSMKLKAQTEGKEQKLELNGLIFDVHRSGIKFYSYRISCKDFLIYFMEKEVKNTPSIKVRFLATYLWSHGLENAFYRFTDWFEGLGLTYSQTKILRIDVCVDSDKTPFKRSDVENVSTRARGKSNHFVTNEYFSGKKFSGFTVGSGDPLLLRIYNKTLEVRTSQKTWFHDIWENANWNKQKDVWRVEFQIRRKGLKEFGISSIDDFFIMENNLWAYLTGKWITLRKPSTDSNASRWPIDPRWIRIQKSEMNQLFSPAIRKRVKVGNTPQLLDQVSGLLLSVGALNNHKDLETTLRTVERWTTNKLHQKNTTFNKETLLRRKQFLEN